MLHQEKNQIKMNYKEILHLESVNSADFKKGILEEIALMLDEKCDCCKEQKEQKEEEWFTAKEMCIKLKICLPTLTKVRENGDIKYKKIGRTYRYSLPKE